MKRLCDRALLRWYREYNERWFEGRLPDDVDILYAPYPGCSAVVDKEESGSFFIQINPAFAVDKYIVQMRILHEMNHIDLWPYKRHGDKFESGMQRLANAGAMKGKW